MLLKTSRSSPICDSRLAARGSCVLRAPCSVLACSVLACLLACLLACVRACVRAPSRAPCVACVRAWCSVLRSWELHGSLWELMGTCGIFMRTCGILCCTSGIFWELRVQSLFRMCREPVYSMKKTPVTIYIIIFNTNIHNNVHEKYLIYSQLFLRIL